MILCCSRHFLIFVNPRYKKILYHIISSSFISRYYSYSLILHITTLFIVLAQDHTPFVSSIYISISAHFFYDACKHINDQYELCQTDDKQLNKMIKYWHISEACIIIHRNFTMCTILKNAEL